MILSLSGFLALTAFDSAPGVEARPPFYWPPKTGLGNDFSRPQLLMFVHPRCACTTASLAGLETLSAEHQPFPADLTFVMYRAGAVDDDGALPRHARVLPASRIYADEFGKEAARFRVRTSGTVLLYSAAGRLLFQGGITGSRGHEGGNFGLAELSGLLTSAPPLLSDPVVSRVFGCAIQGVR
jgi:hypothetical protein